MAPREWTAKEGLFVLLGSMAVTLSVAVGLFLAWRNWQHDLRSNPEFTIRSLLQTGPEREALKTAYLGELLGLSVDCPQNLYAFDEERGELLLLASPLIVRAQIKKMPPSTLYVDYEVRRPIAWISDYRNVGVDAEGHLFPVSPFFSPKEMPEIYLGLPPFGAPADSSGRQGGDWKAPLQDPYFKLALALLETFEGSPWREGVHLQRIDVSNAWAPTLGRREIVLFTEEELSVPKGTGELHFRFPKILRLAPKDYAQQLQNFFALRKTMLEDYRKQLAGLEGGERFSPRIVDLRLGQLAFVETR